MRFLALIGSIAVAMGLAACGGDDDSSSVSSETVAAVAKPAAELRKPARKEPKVVVPTGPPPKELIVRDLRVGDGQVAEQGDQLTAEYIGFNYEDGYQFDRHAHRWGEGEPAEFELGAEDVIPGWDQGIEGMKVGGRRELVIPPNLAYGNDDPPPEIGPNETVVFVVELLGLEKGQ